MHEDGFRALLLLALIHSQYFDLYDQGTAELTKVCSWLSKCLIDSSTWSNEETDTLRRLLCAFAMATVNESTTTKHERITSIVEISLLTRESKSSRVALEWLAVVLSFWYGCEESNDDLSLSYLCTVEPKRVQAMPSPELDFFFETVVNDLPRNVSLFCLREKVSAAMSNQLHRILKHWSESGVDKRWPNLVRRSILSCQISAPNEDAYVTLACSALRETHQV